MYAIYDLIPFNRADVLADLQKDFYKTDPEGLERLRQQFKIQLGYIDRNGAPINIVRRWSNWLGITKLNGEFNGVLQGNFGVSYDLNQRPVAEVIREPMNNTGFINIFATILALRNHHSARHFLRGKTRHETRRRGAGRQHYRV